MFDVEFKKIGAAIVSMVVALSFVICSVCIYGTGLIPGVNPEADQARMDIAVAKRKANTVEGSFVDRFGNSITTATEKGEPAIANYPESFSPIIGYNSSRMGTDGLRNVLRSHLYDGGKDGVGATVQLTINASMQEKLYKLLDGHVGSISIINAETGEIVAMVSRGDPEIGYNINIIDDVYEKAENEDEEDKYYSDLYDTVPEFYYNRATLAQDPPGSTAKVMTATALVSNDREDLVYNDETGYYLNNTIHNFDYEIMGECDIKKGLNKSSNVYFANAGVELGGARLEKTYEKFMVGETIELDFDTLNSTFLAEDSTYSDFKIASNAYGQGDLVMAPLHVAMMMGSIMNKGEMMKPYLIEKITDDNKTVYKKDVETLSKVADKDTCKKVKDLLITNAEYYKLYDVFDKEDITIIAKTGTAELANTNLHHIYYAVGVELEGVPYGICIDRENVAGTSGELKSIAINVIDILMSETAE